MLAALVALAATPLSAQDANLLLLVTGLSGDAPSAKRFVDAARQLHDSARTRWGANDSSIVWLAEDPAADPRRIDGRATRDGIVSALDRLARRTRAGDVLTLVVIGHGSGEGADSKVSLPGADPTARDYALWLEKFAAQRVVVIIAASGSGDFLPVLSGPGRVVITATKSASERNESLFAPFIAAGLTTEAADADKDGTTTLLEAYTFARAAVSQQYAARNVMLTEHAHLDDNGDRTGTPEPGAGRGGDGALARRIAYASRAAASTDPRVTTLTAERRALEMQVEQLRARKATMESAAYERELERLLLQVAAKSRAIRALQPPGRP
jgi:hypothetical protein